MSAIGLPRDASPAKTAAAVTRAEALFLLFVFATPFMLSPPMQAYLVELPGAKLANLIAGAFALFFFLDGRPLLRVSDRLERNALLAFASYIALFLWAFARSVPHIGRFHGMDQVTFPSGAREYALTYLVVPLTVSLLFLYALKRTLTRSAISRLLQTVGLSVFLLSCVVTVAIASRPEVYSDPLRLAMATLFADVLGQHYNGIGTTYVIASPILLFLALTRGSFWTANYFFALLCVVLLESRTALYLFVFMSAVTLITMGRTRTLVSMAPIVAIAALIAAEPLIVRLVTTGFSQRSGLSLYYFLSGREDRIWLPLLIEWWNDPQRFWFGAGEFGILNSFLLSTGVVFGVVHSHNAYIDFFLDNGLILEGILIASIIAFMFWCRRTGKRLKNPLFWVLLLSVVGFLLACLTGRRFYPSEENAILFPIVAVMINIVRLSRQNGAAVRAKPRAIRSEP